MKKIIFLVLAMSFLLAMLLGAGALKESSSSIPVITVKFSEESKITNAVLTGPTGRIYSFTYEPAKGEFALAHKLTLTQALANGNYTLFVDGQDRVENYVNTTQKIELLVPYITISLTNPPLGVSPVPVFDLTVETPGNDALCRYSDFQFSSYDTASYVFQDSSTVHTQFDFNNGSGFSLNNPEAENPLYVFCKQTDNGRINPATFTISYDLTSPEIGAYSEPRVVVDRQDDGRIITNIKVNSDDKVVCRYSNAVPKNASTTEFIADEGNFQNMLNYFGTAEDESNSSSYSTNPIATVNLTGYMPPSGISKQYEFTINVSCINRATFNVGDYTNRTSNTVEVPITVNLLSPIILTKISPPDYTSDTLVYLNFTTNKISSCTYTLNDTTDSLATSGGGKTHTKSLEALPQGSYVVTIDCQAEAAKISKDFTFVIDTTPPTTPLIVSPNASCIKSFSSQFISNDTESGIKGYNYSFEGGGISVKGFASGASPTVTISRDESGKEFNLTTGSGYLFKAKAINNAGLIGAEGTGSPIVYDQTGIMCDHTPPVIFIKQNSTSSGTYITFVCIDAETRCDNASYSYLMDDTTECSGIPISLNYDAEKQAFITLISSSGYFCYEAKDVAGNAVKGSENISVVSSEYCSNNAKDNEETDVDCGGSGTCPRCAIGNFCSENSDCSSLFCDSSTNTCQEPACDDSLENGYETDVDCGGILCRKCELDKKCSANIDCITNYCSFDRRCATPYCNDTIKNGNESDVDCGGNCDKCALGKACMADSDCVSSKCFSLECIQPPIEGNVSVISTAEEATNIFQVIKFLILIVGILSSFGGSGYLYYKKYYVKKPAAKPEVKTAAAPVAAKPATKSRALTPAERFKIAAQKEKERIEKGLEREKIFGVFGKPSAARPAAKPITRPAEKPPVQKILEAIRLRPAVPVQKKEAFEKLGELKGAKEDVFEKLGKLQRESAFEKLGKLKPKNKK